MRVPCGEILSLVPSQRSSVKVRYQGYIFQKKKRKKKKNGRYWRIIVFEKTQLVINILFTYDFAFCL